jgi:hypothetical protein
MRIALADSLWVRRSMDAIRRLADVDPNRADGISWPLGDFQLRVRLHALEGEFWIIGVGRIEHRAPNHVRPAGRRLLLAPDGSGIIGNEFAGPIESAHPPARLVDLDFCHLAGRLSSSNIGYHNRPTGGRKCLPRIERSEKCFARMEFFRQKLERVRIAQMTELRHMLEILRHAGEERAFDISLTDLVLDQSWLVPGFRQPDRLMARVQAVYESVVEIGAVTYFDFFILSDTTNPDIWIAEEAALLTLRDRTGGHERIFYRHRANNVARKAGNIGEWVRQFGGRYPQMLVLDADSLMTGDTIVRLVAAMESHPNVGLIQTLPMIINATTLFARVQQFAGRVYGPLFAYGLAWWHGAEANYWGHNAVLRTQAFAEYAGLPLLSGRKPFGGHILSHDFVEAALMRRGGVAIHLAPGLPGSYEEVPPSLTEYAQRDRRWCQGNLQHLAVLGTSGLHWVSRLHLLTGMGAYLTAPMWLVFLVVGIAISLQAQFIRPEYFPPGFALFPQWPTEDSERAIWVLSQLWRC